MLTFRFVMNLDLDGFGRSHHVLGGFHASLLGCVLNRLRVYPFSRLLTRFSRTNPSRSIIDSNIILPKTFSYVQFGGSVLGTSLTI